MAFITLKRDDGSERTLDIRPDAITAIEQEVDLGNGVVLNSIVHMHGICFQVQEPRAAILAAIAEAEGGADDAPTAVAVEEARDHLAAALGQTVPSDDQIIVGNMRIAHSLLAAALRAWRRP
jgi:hypothetical protein